MPSATCLNDDCDKNEWQLRKHPSQYTRGVTCPDCGTTQVEISGADPADQPAQQAQSTPDQNTAAPPASTGTRAQQGQPAMPQGGEHLQRGAQAGDAIWETVQSGDEADLMQSAAGLLFRIGQRKKQHDQRAREQAKRTDGVQTADQYPECPDCGEQITRVPQGTEEFPCPGCGVMLEVA